MTSDKSTSDTYQEGDRVTVSTEGEVIEVFPDAGLLVEVDGCELLLEGHEVFLK